MFKTFVTEDMLVSSCFNRKVSVIFTLKRVVLFSFAIVLKRKRKLVALLLLSYRCIVTINVLWLLIHNGAVGWSAVCDCGIS